MAVDIDWGLLQQPNEMMQFYQGQNDARQNDLLQTQIANQQASAKREQQTFDMQNAAAQRLVAAKAAAAPKIAAGDYGGAAQEVAAQAPDLAAQYAGLGKDQREAMKATADLRGQILQSALKLPPEQRQAYAEQQLVANKADPSVAAKVDWTNDQQVAALASQQLGVKDQLDQIDKAQTLGLQKDQFGETVRHNQADETHATAQLGETSRHDKASEASASVEANAAAANAATNAKKLDVMANGGGLDPDTIEFYAEKNATDGSVPTLGMGPAAAGVKAAILARSAQIQRGMGKTGADAAATAAGAKANSAALTAQTKAQAAISSFESTANKNLDLALSLSGKGGGPTGVPVLNRYIQAGRKNVAGDPDVAAFDTALGTAADEYAKVVSGGGQNVAATDSARRTAQERINSAMSPAQLHSVIATMKMEMENRAGSMASSTAGLSSSIRNGGGIAAPAASAVPHVRTYNPTTGQLE